MSQTLLIYGANGYTGRLVLEEALARGIRPILSGRSADAIRSLAAEHRLEARPASLDDPVALEAALDGVGVVLHCAGPFVHTSAPMLAACLAHGVHYLDITGEISVFERAAALGPRAVERGITVIPGVGFDVVPSDCLAAHLKGRLPSATRLELAFSGGTGPSHGSALTVIENLGRGGAIRRNGVITPVPTAWRTRRIKLGTRERLCVSIPWGDVSTAFHSTGIPEIIVYMATSKSGLRTLRLSRLAGPLLGTGPVKRFLQSRVRRQAAGPGREALEKTRSYLWGEASDASGAVVRSTLSAPSGYLLTAMTAVRAASRVLAGAVATGFLTPSKAFGAGFILEVPGTTREDLP
jgi:short subunit dehydrogenase-like uncharacterized protein